MCLTFRSPDKQHARLYIVLLSTILCFLSSYNNTSSRAINMNSRRTFSEEVEESESADPGFVQGECAYVSHKRCSTAETKIDSAAAITVSLTTLNIRT